MPIHVTQKDVRLGVVRDLLSRAEKEMEGLKHELDRIETAIRSQEGVRAFLRRQLAAIESPDAKRRPAESDEFANSSLRECVEIVLRDRVEPMRLVDVAGDVLRRGFQTKSEKRSFLAGVFKVLKKGDRFEQVGKRWQIKKSTAE